MRRICAVIVGVTVFAGSAGIVCGDVPAAPSGAATIENVSGGRPSPSRRPLVRRYRSYSIEPGGAGVSDGAVIAAPRATAPMPSTGRSSKPSYTRADSKARGRFHQ